MTCRISFPSATIARSIPALSKDMSVSLTYPRSVEASGPSVVGHAAGGGCLLGSAHESLAKAFSLGQSSYYSRETHEKWKMRYILNPLLLKRLASSKLYSSPLVPPSGFTHTRNRTVFMPPSPRMSSAGLVWLWREASL